MKPIKTDATTSTLGAPKGWNEERYGRCDSLPIAHGDGFCASYWRTTWKERLFVLLGRPIRLVVSVSPGGHPPVYLDTEVV